MVTIRFALLLKFVQLLNLDSEKDT
jgi:hypothetical protein